MLEDGTTYTLNCTEVHAVAPIAFKSSHYTRGKDGAPSEVCPPLSADADRGDQDPLVFDTTQITHPANRSNPKPGDPCHPLAAGAHAPAIAPPVVAGPPFSRTGNERVEAEAIMAQPAPRRLTPMECERLQGFPDGWTETGVDDDGKPYPMSDTQRYRQMGNAVTVNVLEWIGRRIMAAENAGEEGQEVDAA